MNWLTEMLKSKLKGSLRAMHPLVLIVFFIKLTQARVIQQKGTSISELSLQDQLVGMAVANFLD